MFSLLAFALTLGLGLTPTVSILSLREVLLTDSRRAVTALAIGNNGKQRDAATDRHAAGMLPATSG